MAQFFFILGHQPAISLAELLSAWRARGWRAEMRVGTPEFVVADLSADETAVRDLMETLGGTIKCGVCEKTAEVKKSDIFKMLAAGRPRGEKTFFGLSYYGTRKPEALLKEPLKVFALKIKKTLAEAGYGARWVQSKENALSSVIVAKNKLLSGGVEIVFLDAGAEIFTGRTLAVQAFEDFGRRDFGRPERDMESGMLPPKLARIMLNLTGVPADKLAETVILDPFCGSGTVLQEALVLGYGKALGSDISPKALDDARANLKWLEGLKTAKNGSESVVTAGGSYDVKVGDVRQLADIWGEGSADVIVSEPYLGPNRGRFEVSKVKEELRELYQAALNQFQRVLKSGGVVIWLWPLWQASNGELISVPAPDWHALGFEMEEILPAEWIQKMGAQKSPHGGLIYMRAGQRVGREVMRLRRV